MGFRPLSYFEPPQRLCGDLIIAVALLVLQKNPPPSPICFQLRASAFLCELWTSFFDLEFESLWGAAPVILHFRF